MIRTFAFAGGLALMAACTQTQIDEAPEDLGDFKLRINHVVSDKAVKGPVSRDASPEQWKAALTNAIETRLGRYEGRQEYDIGVYLGAYMLAPPGVPVIYNPKSIAIVDVYVYDVGQKKMLAREHRIQVLEDTTGESALVGSGHSRTKEQQIAGLSLKVADAIEEWLAEEHKKDGWFNTRPDTETAAQSENPPGS
ncbi:hypothetical protein M3P21_13775 [Ruegeria sp. 2012CJ41-6]|uniref:DUF4136 domain-containing protein n=1 Tax=Ruegeria spongiae TaxID=2942209 RepID=A0ABT0Q455_9RHOB|nr:hypothetical protein [Ruegeria spongiae]MCL6284600.1 hypothetical protein [Ruegeria spongiae]